MKKTLLAFLLIGSGTALFAQDTTANDSNNNHPAINNMGNWNNNNRSDNMMNDSSGRMNNMNTTSPTQNDNNTNTMNDSSARSSSGSYKAYSNTASSMDVPASIQTSFHREYPNLTDAQWQMSNDWWRANYNDNGRLTSIYYNMKGQSYTLALPVTETLVPDNVIAKATEMYGNNIYDITQMKGMNGQEVYGVRVIENGQSRLERINEDGSMATDSTGYNNNTNGTMNNNWNNSTNNMNNNATDNNQMNNTNNNQMMNSNTNSNTSSSTDMNNTNDNTNNSQNKSDNDKTNNPQ